MEPMRSGPKGGSLHSVPPRHVSAFLPAHVSSSTHWGKQPIAHQGAQAVPRLSVGGNLKAASCPLLCIEAAPGTHVTSQMAGYPQGLWTAISSNLKLRTEEALKYFGEFTWLWTNPHECHGMELPGTKGFPNIHNLELARVSLPPKYGLEVLSQASPQDGRGLLLLRSLTSGSTSNTGTGMGSMPQACWGLILPAGLREGVLGELCPSPPSAPAQLKMKGKPSRLGTPGEYSLPPEQRQNGKFMSRMNVSPLLRNICQHHRQRHSFSNKEN